MKHCLGLNFFGSVERKMDKIIPIKHYLGLFLEIYLTPTIYLGLIMNIYNKILQDKYLYLKYIVSD